jgi:hypothetical protein
MSGKTGDNSKGEPTEEEPYRVGDKNPPKEFQFPAHTSGNLKGRPHGSVNLRTRLAKQARKMVTVTRNGKAEKMMVADLIAARFADAAAKGDLKATLAVMRLDDEPGAAVAVARAEETFETPDKENLRFIMARLRGLTEGDDE